MRIVNVLVIALLMCLMPLPAKGQEVYVGSKVILPDRVWLTIREPIANLKVDENCLTFNQTTLDVQTIGRGEVTGRTLLKGSRLFDQCPDNAMVSVPLSELRQALRKYGAETDQEFFKNNFQTPEAMARLKKLLGGDNK